MRTMIRLGIILLFAACDSFAQQVLTLDEFWFPTVADTFAVRDTDLADVSGSWQLKWNTEIFKSSSAPYTVSNPLLRDGFIFVSKAPEFAIKAATGEKVHFGSAEAARAFASFGGDSLIYFTGLDNSGGAALVNILTGERRWTSAQQPVAKAPFFVNDVLLFRKKVGNLWKLVAMDLSTMTDMWSMPLERFSYGEAYLGPDYVIVKNQKQLIALDLRSGRILWQMAMQAYHIYSDGEFVYVGSEGKIYALRAKRTERPEIAWALEGHGPIVDLTTKGDLTYVLTPGELFALNADKGRIVWKAAMVFNATMDFDLLAVTDSFVVAPHYEMDRFNLVFDRWTGEMVATDMDFPAVAPLHRLCGRVDGDIFFATDAEGARLYALEVQRSGG